MKSKHVIPEYGRFVTQVNTSWQSGIDYRQPPYTYNLIEAGQPNDLGKYLKAATQTIPKKNVIAFWDTFAEIFGMPMRIAKTTSRDQKDIDRLDKMLQSMGASMTMVAPMDTEIEFMESGKGDAFNVYDKRIDRANSELSKLIIGQTMTIEDGSSLSQSETHLQVFQNLVEADADMLRDVINNQLIPRMVRHGFPIDGLRFDWDTAIDYTPEQQYNIEQLLIQHFDVEPEYFTNKYGIPCKPKPDTQASLNLSQSQSQTIRHAFESLMSALHSQQGATLSIELLATPQAQAFITTHADILDSSFKNVDMSDAMRRRLHRSDWIFSGIKTFHELNEAFPSLLDSNGNRKTFEQFLKDVQSIDQTYNVNYLRSEYEFAQSSAIMAAKWEQIEQDGDRYNLQYRTANDDKVRPEHQELHGVTLPPSDPFWQEFYPPNGWGCRCTVVQVRKSKYPTTDPTEARARGEAALQIHDPKGMFRFNPGIQGKTFPDYNPYTISQCKNCDIAKGKLELAYIPNNEVCAACKLANQCYAGKNAKSERERIKKNKYPNPKPRPRPKPFYIMIQAITIAGESVSYSISETAIAKVLGTGYIYKIPTFDDILRIIYHGLSSQVGYLEQEFVTEYRKGHIYTSRKRNQYPIRSIRPRILQRIRQVNKLYLTKASIK